MSPTCQHASNWTWNTPARTVMGDVYRGFVDLAHNGMALTGMMLAIVTITLSARADLRQEGERQLLTWLQERLGNRILPGISFENKWNSINLHG